MTAIAGAVADDRIAFLVGGDPQYLAEKSDEPSRLDPYSERASVRMVQILKQFAGRTIPERLGGGEVSSDIRGLIVTGDLIDSADKNGGSYPAMQRFEWERFVSDFGVTARDGRIPFPAYELHGNHDGPQGDTFIIEEIIRRLRAAKMRRATDGTPFFITAGFVRPHLPFSDPQKYWNLFDPADLPMPERVSFPEDAPNVALKRRGEITAYKPVPESGEIGPQLTRQLIHGYYASTSFVDAQVGKVTSELDEHGLADSTIVVLWGDHGFHLGDLGIWTKHTNYEQANRIPILISAPGITRPNTSTKHLAESVDIFPTLSELAGLPAPKGP